MAHRSVRPDALDGRSIAHYSPCAVFKAGNVIELWWSTAVVPSKPDPTWAPAWSCRSALR